MLRKIIFFGVFSFFMICVSGSFLIANDAGPTDITINKDGKKPAVFPHKLHQKDYGCGECHHGISADGTLFPYAAGQKIYKCADCHNDQKLVGKMKDKHKLDTTKGAGHGSCLDCHKAMEAEDNALKDKMIAKCETCHPKK